MISAIKNLHLGVNGNSNCPGNSVVVAPCKLSSNQEWELIGMDGNGWNINSNPQKTIHSGVVYRVGNLLTLRSVTEQRAGNRTVVVLFYSHCLLILLLFTQH